MKLIRLRADGFGPLKGEYHFAPDRLTLIVDQNERGKTSLLSAVAAALYGLPDDKRSHRLMTPTERWRPWQGGPYRIEVEIESEGERYVITRDFERGAVSVWNGRGQDLTWDFREGKDEFPVGKKLLGLDADEFEKCAFLRQGELDQVVPLDERERRASTLHARLENAADTRLGDTNASEAMRVLEDAASRYPNPDGTSPIKVETALHRLDLKQTDIEVRLHEIEVELRRLDPSIEQLARLHDDETQARAAAAALERERRRARAGELSTQLRRDDDRRGEIDRLRAEAQALAARPDASPSAEGDLRAAIARHEGAVRNAKALALRLAEANDERRTLDLEIAGHERYGSAGVADADRLAARSEEIRRLDREHQRIAGARETARAEMSARGFEFERAAALSQRFDSMASAQQELLHTQPRRTLAYQAELAEVASLTEESDQLLDEIGRQRRARAIPGSILLVIGLAAAIGGGVAAWLGLALPWIAMLAGGTVLTAVGAGLAASAAGLRREDREREDATRFELQERGRQLVARKTDNDRMIETLARELRVPGAEILLREWDEHTRLLADHLPLRNLDQEISAIGRQREHLLAETRSMLERFGDGNPDPDAIETAASHIRRLAVLREKHSDSSRRWARLEEEERQVGAAVNTAIEQGRQIVTAAGLTYDPKRSIEQQLPDVAAAVEAVKRRRLIEALLLPSAEGAIMPAPAREAVESQLQMIEAGLRESGADTDSAAATAPARTPAAIEADLAQARERIEALTEERAALRSRVDQEQRRLLDIRRASVAERQTTVSGLARARRFKRAADLARTTIEQIARDTHRRWADFLNQRVSELLGSFGTQIESVRFGEDLDFAVRLVGGHPVARGKAVLMLSTGARDQLHLAVRIAISEFLSNGRSALPLLIDDCFATSDDERARAGMNLLIEHLSKQHQIVLVTCHRGRHEALAALDPELYQERVQWVQVNSEEMVG